jgi:hypothetical protein
MSAGIGSIPYSATSRSSAVGALCRELVAGDVPDDELLVTFDNLAGFMFYRSFHATAGTTTTEGDAPIHRVKWAPYLGPQNAQRVVAYETEAASSVPPAYRGGSEGNASVEAPPLSVTCECCGEAFTPHRSTARFCSTRCRMTAHRKAPVEERAARRRTNIGDERRPQQRRGGRYLIRTVQGD